MENPEISFALVGALSALLTTLLAFIGRQMIVKLDKVLINIHDMEKSLTVLSIKMDTFKSDLDRLEKILAEHDKLIHESRDKINELTNRINQ
jgi:uncharacterized coiled-coil protein SlyX